MKQVKYIECDICGKKVKSQGMGGHKALAHGIVDRVVVSNTSNDTSTRVKRPSDYTKKKEKVIETRVGISPTPRVEQIFRGPDELGRMMCKHCGGWFPSDISKIPSFYECVKGKKHEY